MTRRTRHDNESPKYMPTPEQIAAECDAIQEEKAREHQAKMQIPAKVYTVDDLRPARIGE